MPETFRNCQRFPKLTNWILQKVVILEMPMALKYYWITLKKLLKVTPSKKTKNSYFKKFKHTNVL